MEYLQRIKSFWGEGGVCICKNTMETMEWTEKDFIDGIDYTQAGKIVIERQGRI